jgi:hypothetical protein
MKTVYSGHAAGNEVTGPSVLRAGPSTLYACVDNGLHRIQAMFMRQLAGGVRKSTSRQLVLREFGCRPLARTWVQSMVSLRNDVLASRDG